MDSKYFDRPVKVMFGKPGQIRVVSSAREAGECLASQRWPQRDKRKNLAARRACLKVLEGLEETSLARVAFESAAREADILVE